MQRGAPIRSWLAAALALPALAQTPGYPHAREPIGTVREVYDGTLAPDVAIRTFRNIDRLFPTRLVPRSPKPLPLPVDAAPLADVRFAHRGEAFTLESYLEANRVAALLVLKDGRIELERYRFGNTRETRWMSMSVAKSITSTLVGAAIRDGAIGSVNDPVVRYVPALAGSAYEGVKIRDVLLMASGVKWNEVYSDANSDRRRLLDAQIAQQPGSAMALMKSLPRAAPPGTLYNYSTGETQVIAEVVRSAVKRPLATYLAERIWSRFGMEADADWWLDSPDGVEIGGSGFSATLRDYGRFGLFALDGGVAAGEKILPDGWIADAASPKALEDGKPMEYGYLWWTGTTDSSKRDGAYAARGIYGQSVYVNPKTRVVIVVWSALPKPTGSEKVDDWTFFDAVNAALAK